MNRLIVKYLIITLLLLGKTHCFSQSNTAHLLDSLAKHVKTVVSIEKKIGYEKSADSILKHIDTTIVSIKQVTNILNYYKHHRSQEKEVPFPFLHWSTKASKKLKYDEGEVKSLIALGNSYLEIDNPEGGSYYKKVLEIQKKRKNKLGIIHTKTRLGLYYMHTKEHDKSIHYFLDVLNTNRSNNNYKAMVVTHHNLGDTYIRSTDTLNALHHFIKSSELEEKYTYNDVKAMNDNFLGSIYLRLDSLDLAKNHYELSTIMVQKTGVVPYLLNSNYFGLGKIKEQQKHFKKAYTYYRKVYIESYKRKRTSYIFLNVATRMANLLINEHRDNEAINLLLTTEKYAKQENLSSYRDLKHQEKIGFYKVLSLAYRNIKNYKKAHIYLEKSVESNEKTKRVQILNKISTIEKKYATQIEAQKAKILKDEHLLKRRKFIITILTLIGILSIALFSILYYRLLSKFLKRKSRLDALKIENQRVYAEKLLKEKKITLLELELKQKELTTNSISLLQKKEQYNSLIKRLKSFNLNISSKNQKEEFNTIISECIANKMSFNWEELKLTFEKVHLEFYNNLLKKHPDLSPNEKKICAFLKLGMNTKDIASVTNKIERTVITARSRLRKKMKLEISVNLENYISSF